MTNLTIKINFDMDGTIADLYGVDNWLEMLINEDTTPYSVAQPLVRLSALARRLNHLQKQGYEIGIISWLSKSGTAEYNERVAQAKLEWLAKHMPSVEWDTIHIVPYGTPKNEFCDNEMCVLFDDEPQNRENWGGRAYDVHEIFQNLEELKNSYWIDQLMMW